MFGARQLKLHPVNLPTRKLSVKNRKYMFGVRQLKLHPVAIIILPIIITVLGCIVLIKFIITGNAVKDNNQN
jgi:uncharacterized membrane protein YhdT